MTKTEQQQQDAIEQGQSDTEELDALVDTLQEALRNGGSCETMEDLIANFDDAIQAAQDILAQLKESRAELTAEREPLAAIDW